MATTKNKPAESSPAKATRTSKSPIEAAKANALAANVQLENLGGRLFKIGKPQLTEDLRQIIESLTAFREQL